MMRLMALLLLAHVRAFRGPGLSPHRRLNMRSRWALAAMSSNETSVGGLASLLGINRYTPEAQANQLEWAREQMSLEMPNETLEGNKIADKQDFIAKYIEAEKDNFDRNLTWEEAEREVDQWLLKQATFAPARTNVADIVLALVVFLGAFGVGLFLNHQ